MKMDRLLNAWISALCKVMKGVNEMINDSVLQWSGLIESMGNDGMAKRVYAGMFMKLFGR